MSFFWKMVLQDFEFFGGERWGVKRFYKMYEKKSSVNNDEAAKSEKMKIQPKSSYWSLLINILVFCYRT